jgi:hypothetical protein
MPSIFYWRPTKNQWHGLSLNFVVLFFLNCVLLGGNLAFQGPSLMINTFTVSKIFADLRNGQQHKPCRHG